jgi:hypothetical protein
MLCGCKTYGAIAQWGRECDLELAQSLGFSVVTTADIERRPAAGTLFYALQALDRNKFERQLTAWVQEVLLALPPAKGTMEALAIDGKTLRGSAKILKGCVDWREEVPGVHLLSAFSHRLGLTLAQRSVADKGSEITVTPQLLEGLMLEGRVVTMDALLTQRAIAKAITKKKATT